MVAGCGPPSLMGDSSDFFRDFHGVQQLREPQGKRYSIAESEYDKIEGLFKYCPDFETAKGLLYLDYLRSAVRRQVEAKGQDDGPRDEMVYETTMKALKEFKLKRRFNRQAFVRLPASAIERISQAIENVVDRLPSHYFERPRRLKVNALDPREPHKDPNPLFYVPLRDSLPEIERKLDKGDNKGFSLLYTEQARAKGPQRYPLESMFNVYKASIPNYSYEEFRAIVEEQLGSGRSDDEVVAFLLDTFGCSLFDFITEIVRNRDGQIDFSKAPVLAGLVSRLGRKGADAVIAGTVTVQSEKESNLLKKLRKIEKKDRGRVSNAELEQAEAEYEVAKSAPICACRAAAFLGISLFLLAGMGQV